MLPEIPRTGRSAAAMRRYKRLHVERCESRMPFAVTIAERGASAVFWIAPAGAAAQPRHSASGTVAKLRTATMLSRDIPTAPHPCQPDRANSMWPVSLDRAGIVPFASLLSHTGRQLRRLPPRLRRSWCRSIRKLPALTVAVRALDRRYAWLSLTVAVLAAPGAIILAALAATPAGTSTKPTVVVPAAPGRRAPENLAVASARSTPQAGATLAAAHVRAGP